MPRFNDEDYDGVVLKFPTWFININNLEGTLLELREKLESGLLSSQYPDHVNNIEELTYYKKKSELLKAEEKRQKELQEKEKEKYRKLLSQEMYRLTWEDVTSASYEDSIIWNGSRIDTGDLYGGKKKTSLKPAFEREFKEKIKTFEDLKTFTSLNRSFPGLAIAMEQATEEMIDMDYVNVYPCGWLSVGVRLRRLTIGVDCRVGRKNDMLYNNRYLINKDGVYGYSAGNNTIMLDGFVRDGMYLVKK